MAEAKTILAAGGAGEGALSESSSTLSESESEDSLEAGGGCKNTLEGVQGVVAPAAAVQQQQSVAPAENRCRSASSSGSSSSSLGVRVVPKGGRPRSPQPPVTATTSKAAPFLKPPPENHADRASRSRSNSVGGSRKERDAREETSCAKPPPLRGPVAAKGSTMKPPLRLVAGTSSDISNRKPRGGIAVTLEGDCDTDRNDGHNHEHKDDDRNDRHGDNYHKDGSNDDRPVGSLELRRKDDSRDGRRIDRQEDSYGDRRDDLQEASYDERQDDRRDGSYDDRNGGSHRGDRQDGPYFERRDDRKEGSHHDRRDGKGSSYHDRRNDRHHGSYDDSRDDRPDGSHNDRQDGSYNDRHDGTYHGRQDDRQHGSYDDSRDNRQVGSYDDIRDDRQDDVYDDRPDGRHGGYANHQDDSKDGGHADHQDDRKDRIYDRRLDDRSGRQASSRDGSRDYHRGGQKGKGKNRDEPRYEQRRENPTQEVITNKVLPRSRTPDVPPPALRRNRPGAFEPPPPRRPAHPVLDKVPPRSVTRAPVQTSAPDAHVEEDQCTHLAVSDPYMVVEDTGTSETLAKGSTSTWDQFVTDCSRICPQSVRRTLIRAWARMQAAELVMKDPTPENQTEEVLRAHFRSAMQARRRFLAKEIAGAVEGEDNLRRLRELKELKEKLLSLQEHRRRALATGEAAWEDEEVQKLKRKVIALNKAGVDGRSRLKEAIVAAEAEDPELQRFVAELEERIAGLNKEPGAHRIHPLARAAAMAEEDIAEGKINLKVQTKILERIKAELKANPQTAAQHPIGMIGYNAALTAARALLEYSRRTQKAIARRRLQQAALGKAAAAKVGSAEAAKAAKGSETKPGTLTAMRRVLTKVGSKTVDSPEVAGAKRAAVVVGRAMNRAVAKKTLVAKKTVGRVRNESPASTSPVATFWSRKSQDRSRSSSGREAGAILERARAEVNSPERSRSRPRIRWAPVAEDQYEPACQDKVDNVRQDGEVEWDDRDQRGQQRWERQSWDDASRGATQARASVDAWHEDNYHSDKHDRHESRGSKLALHPRCRPRQGDDGTWDHSIANESNRKSNWVVGRDDSRERRPLRQWNSESPQTTRRPIPVRRSESREAVFVAGRPKGHARR